MKRGNNITVGQSAKQRKTAARNQAAPSALNAQPAVAAPRTSKPLSAAQLIAEMEQQRRTPCQEAPGDLDGRLSSGAQSGQSTGRANGPAAPQVIKLGVDVHLHRYVVVRQIDGGAPQPPQRFSPAQFLQWAQKQTQLAAKVYSCYEAGPFGYGLHRKLTALGIANYVVRPRDWDEYGKRVKTDKRDARQLALHLDRYVGGNGDAFCVVRVPTEAEEQSRSRSRQRESLRNEKQRLAAQGRSQALYYGCRLQGEWWLEGAWKELTVPPIVQELLAPLRRLIQAIEQELKVQTQAIEQAAPPQLPVGLGKLTYEVLEREVCDWHRFRNRRQVASYTGMCPREDTSDQRRFQGAINKHGNRRMRSVLVEAAWRLIQFQPTYHPVAKWRALLAHPKATKSKRKQIAVAIGRQFSVDWWRVRTQRCRAADLGLQLNPAAAPPSHPPKRATGSRTASPCTHRTGEG